MPIRFEGMDYEYGYRADLLVEHKRIVGAKYTEGLHVIHFARLLKYPRLGRFKPGLLINFDELRWKHSIRQVANVLLAYRTFCRGIKIVSQRPFVSKSLSD